MKIYSIFSMHVIIVNNSFVHVYIFKNVKIHNVNSKFTLLLPVKTTVFTPMIYAFFLHGSVYVDSSDTLVMHK